MKKNSSKNSQKNTRVIVRIFAIILITLSLIIGIFFSTSSYAKNYKLGSDFNGQYVGLVGVKNTNSDDKDPSNQPNGDAKEAAKVLNDRLNPLGTKDIRVEIAGLNYLKVSAPIDEFGNENQFRNEIQKSGGVILMNETFDDIQSSGTGDSYTRNALSDYFSSAEASTITSNGGATQKVPVIKYVLNGSKMSEYISSGAAEGAEQEAKKQLKIVTDVDAFYDSIRKYYEIVDGDEIIDRAEDFYDDIVHPLRETYNNSSTSEITKRALYDLFYYEYSTQNTNGLFEKHYGSLVEDRQLRDAQEFAEHYNTFEFLSLTNKYVYDPNAKTEDFKDDGKYGIDIYLYAADGGNVSTTVHYKVNELFNSVNKVMFSFLENATPEANTVLQKHFLFSGEISAAASATTQGYISGNDFITIVDNATVAKSGATIFNSAGKGFSFVVSNVTINDSEITDVMFALSSVILIIIAIVMAVFMIFFYRLLGLFSLIITLSISVLALLSTTWFNLTFGPESFAALLIVVGINLEITSILFESLKLNLFEKRRGVKTSFKIASKDTIAIAIDSIVVLLIANISVFWIGTAALKSFAIIVTLGSFFTLIETVIVARILYSLIINTNIFNKNTFLLALNTDFAKQGHFVLSYKIKNVSEKIEKLKIENKKNVDINSLEAKLKKLEEKMEIKNKKHEEKLAKIENKNIQKIQKQIEVLENKLSKVDIDKKPKKAKAIDFKIDELKYLIEGKDEVYEVGVESSTTSRTRMKLAERSIFIGSRVLSAVFAFIVLLGGLLFGFGITNYDNSFGNSRQYTIWGSYIETSYNNLEIFSQAPDVNEGVREFAEKQIEYVEENSNDDKDDLKKAEAVANTIQFILSNNDYAKYFIGNSNQKLDNFSVKVETGDDFTFDINSQKQVWFSLSVNTTKNDQSRLIKRVITKFTAQDSTAQINETRGYISKNIKPYTSNNLLKQAGYAVLAIVLAMIIYILIRFKWTYYVAIALGALVSVLVTFGAVVVLQIPLGITMISGLITTVTFALILLFITLGKAKAVINQKNEKSLNIFYNTEIELAVETKNKKDEIKKYLMVQKHELRKKIKIEDELSKEDKKNLKAEFKKIAAEKWSEYKTFKKVNKEKVLKESKRNNYLKDIFVTIFKNSLTKMAYVGVFFIVAVAVLTATMPPLFGFGIVLIIGFVISVMTTLFIALPVWILLEQVRIKQRLSSKRFINNLKVSGEEQLVEGVNA